MCSQNWKPFAGSGIMTYRQCRAGAYTSSTNFAYRTSVSSCNLAAAVMSLPLLVQRLQCGPSNYHHCAQLLLITVHDAGLEQILFQVSLAVGLVLCSGSLYLSYLSSSPLKLSLNHFISTHYTFTLILLIYSINLSQKPNGNALTVCH